MTAPPLPGRVFDRELPDGSNTYITTKVDTDTGVITTEVVRVPPSQARARRLAARQARHDEAEAAKRERARMAARQGASACRAALPPKPVPPGLQRPAGPQLLDPLAFATGPSQNGTKR